MGNSPTLDEADVMIATSRESVDNLAEAFMYRHHPQAKITGKWVRINKLGKILMVRGASDFSFGRNRGGIENAPLAPERSGGGTLWAAAAPTGHRR